MGMKKNLTICLILLMLVIFTGCNKGEKLQVIDFEDTLKIEGIKSARETELNICVGSMITPEEGYAYYKRLLNYIEKKLEVKIKFVEKKTYREVNDLLEHKNIDVAFVCGGPYVRGHDRFGLEILVAPVVRGETVYYSYIIVNKDSGIKRIEGLNGKVFAFVDPLSNTGKLVPTYILSKLGYSPKSFFSKTIYTYSHDGAIKAVARNIVDGAAVDSLIWDYMDNKNNRFTRQTRVITVSEPYGIPPVVVRPGLDDGLKVKLRNILVNMHNEKEGRAILKGMIIDRFSEVDDSIYNSIREVSKRIKW